MDHFVQLVFYEWLNRNELAELVDFMLRYVQFKGIMMLPMSFCVSLCMSSQNAIIKYYSNGEKGDDEEQKECVLYGFMEDYTLVDTYSPHNENKYDVSLENQDHTEEFSRMKVFHDFEKYV